jgi:ankyrin repeat protein
LDKGAVVSAQDLEESTASHLAADQGQREMINLLIDNRAEEGLVDKLSYAPLYRYAQLRYGRLHRRWAAVAKTLKLCWRE